MTADYEAFVEGLMRGETLDQSTLDRWNRFVAGEELPGADTKQTAEEGEAKNEAEAPGES